MPRVSGASHVSFSVRDLGVALDWFRRVFDAEVLIDEPGDERSAAVLSLPGTDLLVGLTQFADGPDDPFDSRRTGLDHFAFALASEANVHEWVAHLDDLGVEHSGPLPVSPGVILNFKGPDGIALAFLWRRPPG
jgi:glyoxylase I family protein